MALRSTAALCARRAAHSRCCVEPEEASGTGPRAWGWSGKFDFTFTQKFHFHDHNVAFMETIAAQAAPRTMETDAPSSCPLQPDQAPDWNLLVVGHLICEALPHVKRARLT